MNTRLISSYLFFINIYISFYKKNYIYTFLFSNLLISSVILHWLQYDFNHLEEEIQLVKKIDSINVNLIIIYGFYLFLYKNFKQKNNIFINGIIIYLFYFVYIYIIMVIIKKNFLIQMIIKQTISFISSFNGYYWSYFNCYYLINITK